MAKFAIVKDNLVFNCIKADSEQVVKNVLQGIRLDYDSIVEETPDTKPAGVGFEYLQGKFRPIQPSKAYVWDENTWSWKPKDPAPADDGSYFWNPGTEAWQLAEVIGDDVA